jgi:hypothetical protein
MRESNLTYLELVDKLTAFIESMYLNGRLNLFSDQTEITDRYISEGRIQLFDDSVYTDINQRVTLWLEQQLEEYCGLNAVKRFDYKSDELTEAAIVRHTNYIEKAKQDNKFWFEIPSITDVEHSQSLMKFGFERFVPGEISFYNIGELYVSYNTWRGTNLSYHFSEVTGIYYSTLQDRLMPSRYVESRRRTESICNSCRVIVSYNKDTVTCKPRGSWSRERYCMHCIIGRDNFVNIWSVDNMRFEFVHTLVDANRVNPTETVINNIPRQSLRNIKRYDYLDAVKAMLYSVPFTPYMSVRDYNYELNWRLFNYVDGEVSLIPLSHSNNIFATKAEMHQDVDWYKPIGMELEIQARNEVNEDIINLLTTLHSEVGNYGLTFTQSNQLAVASYDGSLGSNGVEFKFQPMTHTFVDKLPEIFWDTLQNDWRGYFNKRCGMHMNMGRGLFTVPQLAVWIAWHNAIVAKYLFGTEDQYIGLSDIMQRTDAGYATWALQALNATDVRARMDMSDFDSYLLHHGWNSAVRQLRTGYSSSNRTNLVNYSGRGRIEYRGFASATLKPRIMKNYEFLTALLEYCDVIASGLTELPTSEGQPTMNIITHYFVHEDEGKAIAKHISDEQYFYHWVLQNRSDKYPNLTQYIEQYIIRNYPVNIDSEVSSYLNNRTA